VDSKSLVTVTIPSYNYVQYLRECVESAADQDGVDVDVVIVENASTDGSRDLARGLAEEHDNVRLVEHAENFGIICSLDRCRDEVRGEYTVLLCADDCLTPGSLRRSVEFMDAHRRVGLSYGPVVNFGRLDEVGPAQLDFPEQAPIIYAGTDWIRRCTRIGAAPIHTPEAVMRSSTLARAGRLDPACPKTSDVNMWLRMAAYDDVAYLPGPPLALFRRHESNDSAQYTSVEDLEHEWRAFSRFLDVVPDRPERAEWEASARRALASQARSLAARAWMHSDREGFDAEEVDQLLEFASTIHPDGARLTEYGTRLRHTLGAKATRTLLIPKRAVNRYQRAAGWKRIRRRGV
jgi:glycosyltransferase involved in cell wall biosynthesis